MLDLSNLVGNAAVKHRLEGDRGLSHAYILAGPAGCGKRTLAGRLAAALLCEGEGTLPCGRCSGCRKATAGIHPDLIRLGEDGKNLAVAQIRDMRSDAYVRPNEGARKVYLVENAQTLNDSAQNALLKLLEDGPPYAAFLLLTDNVGSMLVTVRSRCEVLNLSPVTPAEAEGFLLERFPSLPREQVLDAASRCEGVLGRAVTWLEGGGEEARQTRQDARELVTLMRGTDELALLEYCVRLEKWDRQALGDLLVEAVQQLRDGMTVGGETPNKRTLALVSHLNELRGALEFNTGAGHVAGWLCAGAFGTPPAEYFGTPGGYTP